MKLRSFAPALLLAVCPAMMAGQSIFDSGIRGGPQYVSYSLAAPTSLKITELAVPLFTYIPIGGGLTLDVGTSYASAQVKKTDSSGVSSNISGFTDTQIRGTYSVGDFLVLTTGVSLPTGRATAKTPEILAAGLIGSEFLSFPVGSMGTGLGGTAGLALALPVNGWDLGMGISGRHSRRFQPFAADSGQLAARFVPGNEYRARIGIDHPVGTGSVALGFTYAKSSNDSVTSGNSSFNTGDRMTTQFSFVNSFGIGDLALTAFNLFRKAGTLADGTPLGHEDLTDAQLSYGMNGLGGRVEPTFEVKNWTQEAYDATNNVFTSLPTSLMATVGVRYSTNVGGIGVAGSGGYGMGRLAAATASGVPTTANLTGFRAALALQLSR